MPCAHESPDPQPAHSSCLVNISSNYSLKLWLRDKNKRSGKHLVLLVSPRGLTTQLVGGGFILSVVQMEDGSTEK